MINTQRWFEAHFHHVRPRVVAALVRRFADTDIADEAFSAACEKALLTWPERGHPDDPVAWLIRAGGNARLDAIRQETSANNYQGLLADQINNPSLSETNNDGINPDELGDDVLRLLFVCCHPDLSAEHQISLALKIVAGLTTAELASAFLLNPSAMERRLSRSKKVVKNANIPFETPSRPERHKRLSAVSLMLYLMFNEGWYATAGDIAYKSRLCEEAIRLVRELLSLFPASSELMGLFALFLLHYSKRHARLDKQQNLVTLEEQNRSLWDQDMILEADCLLQKASRHNTPGPYQIQAGIAQVHSRAKEARDTNWPEIRQLYDALLRFEPTPVIALNRAVVTARIEGAQAGLNELEKLSESLDSYRWLHTAKAGLLTELNLNEQAITSYERALQLNPTTLEERHISDKIASLKK